MNSFACLFDIDGVLTLPITEQRTISVIDPQIIEILTTLQLSNIKLALISGRAYPWVEMFLLRQFKTALENIPIFMEYGLTSYVQGKLQVSKKAKEFRDEFFFAIMSSIKQTCQEHEIFFELKPSVDYPSHGSLFLEQKNGMISILSNTNISTETVHNLVELSVQDFKDDIRILKHHLGIDILPKGWGKEQAAIQAYFLLDPKKEIHDWFVFGDNESDREMCKPLSIATFVDTKIGASEKTISYIKGNLF